MNYDIQYDAFLKANMFMPLLCALGTLEKYQRYSKGRFRDRGKLRDK